MYARQIGQVQVGPKETNLIWPNTQRHYEVTSHADVLRGSSRVPRTHDEPLRTSAWDATLRAKTSGQHRAT